jgi:Flp pilus assembly protein TadD
MQKTRRVSSASMLICTALLLSGCNSVGTNGLSSFGNSLASSALPTSVDPYPDDQVLAAAKTHFSEGNYGHAARYFERAVEISRDDPEAWLGLAASYDRVRRFDLSDRAYREAARLIGDRPEYYNNVGYSYLLRGDVAKARANFLKARELDSTSPTINNNLELIRDAMGRSRGA